MNWKQPDGQEMQMTDEILNKMGEAVAQAVAENKPGTPALPRRRPAVVDEPSKTQAAMNAVDRRAEVDGWQIEAFVDQAIHARIVAARGAYLPGPRDAYVRRIVLDAIGSITDTNSHTIDR